MTRDPGRGSGGGRGATGAAFGDGARSGERGRGIVVARCLEGRLGGEEGCGFVWGVGVEWKARAGCWVDGEGWTSGVVVGVVVECRFNVPVARTSSSMRLVVCGAIVAAMEELVVSLETVFVSVLLAAALGADCVVATGFVAWPVFAVDVVFASLFMVFALIPEPLLAPAFLLAAVALPASSGTTFFGRPRFLTAGAGGSIVAITDISRGQLTCVSKVLCERQDRRIGAS